MYARDKLHQCFGCAHRFECWGLLENIPLGKSEKVLFISKLKTVKFVIKHVLKGGKLTLGEFYGILSLSIMASLGVNKPNRRDVYQCIFLMAALSNSSNDGWECPGESEEGEPFIFTHDMPEVEK